MSQIFYEKCKISSAHRKIKIYNLLYKYISVAFIIINEIKTKYFAKNRLLKYSVLINSDVFRGT